MHKGNNFFSSVVIGLALAPQSVGQATATGATISEPWRIGRQLSFILLGGVFGTAVAATCKLEGLLRSDGATWQTLKEDDGVTDLGFTASKLADTAVLEGGALLGTVDVSRFDSTTYKAIRLKYVQATAAVTALMAAAYVISDLYSHPSTQTDDLFSKTIPA